MRNATTFATVLRAFDHDREPFEAGSVHRLPTGQFNEWSAPGVDLVRKSTDAEIAKATGEQPARKTKPRRTRKAGAAPTVPATAPVAEPVEHPAPASDEV